MANDIRQCVIFPEVFRNAVVCTFDAEATSSDGGALLLGALDRGVKLTERIVQTMSDRREPGKVDHSYLELFRQRVYAIALGYSDCSDAATLADDPVLKELCGRRAVGGSSLASQPTLCRFENAPTARDLTRMGREFEESVVARHRKRLGKHVRRITIDFDPTDDPTHGQQQFSFFNGHYDTWCYLPLLGFLQFDDEPEQFLFSARLRPGNAKAPRAFIPLLRRTIRKLRVAFPRARLRVRLDGGFASPAVFDFLDQARVEYVVAMGENERLQALADPWIRQIRQPADAAGKPPQVFGAFDYAARSWSRERTVVVKAEMVYATGREPRENVRYVVTNLAHQPRRVYDIYRARGDVENRIKELHHGLQIDRTSCSRFLANQFRVLQTSVAYVLYQEIRLRARRTPMARAQVQTIRERLFKIGAWAVESVRRLVLHLSTHHPWQSLWARIAQTVGALPA